MHDEPHPEPASAPRHGRRLSGRRAGARALLLSLVVVALLVGLLVVPSRDSRAGATAAAAQPPATEPGAGARLAVVGDSLVYMSATRLEAALAADGWRASVQGDVGFTVADQLDKIVAAAAGHPDVAVIALGTNDAFHVTDGLQTLADTRRHVAEALAAVADVPCVVWVDVTTKAPGATWQSNARRVDRMIEDALAARPGGLVAHWDALSGAEPSWFLPDGVHHTDAGKDAYTALIASSVERCRA